MANFNDATQRKTGFFHALGYVLTKFTNEPANELYKSAHNVQSNEVWIDSITFSIGFTEAAGEAIQNAAVTQVGDLSTKALLYPLKNSDRQAWFLDTGTPTFDQNGFIPSSGWVRPLISPVDVTNDAGAPSLGFQFKLYTPSGNEIPPLNGRWEVDYYAGILKFQEGFTPTDSNNGLGFQININDFFNAPDKVTFLETNGPRSIAFQYTGRYLSDLDISEPTGVVNFEDSDTISFTQSGDTYSAFIKPDSITVSNLKTVEGGATAGYLLSNDGSGNFKWIEPIPSEGSITMEDYNTGQSFTNVQNIIIRGGVVTTPLGTATGGLATETAPNTVTVWIPAPNYSGPFSPNLAVSSTLRYVSKPTSNVDLGLTQGYFGVGDWNVENDFFSSNTRRSVTNIQNISSAFSTPNFFNCYGPNGDGIGTTMSFSVFDSNNNVIVDINNFTIDLGANQTNGAITITVTDFENDADRKKAKVTGSINLNTLMPNGGRFSYNITHYNGEPGNDVLSSTSNQFFYDAPFNQTDVSSTAKISGSVTFDESNIIITRKFSGVAYYNTGSQFGVTVSGINLLNQISFPSDKQIQLTANNMLTSTGGVNTNTMKGLANDITGWTIDWNSTGLTFSSTISVNSNGRVPGFATNNNNLSTTPSSNIKADIYDYDVADSKTSASKLMLFETNTTSNGSFNVNPVNGEGNRLSVSTLLSSGILTFNSDSVLPSDELQYIFGRVIYPQHNFNNFFPSINTSVDYSNLSGSNKTFVVYNDTQNGTTTNVNINGYRWYVTNPFGKNAQYDIDFANGEFVFNCNFVEGDLDWKLIDATPGNGDLVIMLGLDPGTNGNRPTKFIYLTGDYPGRSNPTTNNLNNSTKKLSFTTGNVIGSRKVWLLIGYKNNTRGKSLILSNINFQ